MECNYRFAVYRHTLVIEGGVILSRNFIVLKDEHNNIVRWTDFHKYVRTARNKMARKVTDDGAARFFNVCSFLNYLFFETESIRRLTDVSMENIQDFLNAYGMARNGSNRKQGRTEATVSTCIRNVLEFAEEIARQNKGKVGFQPKDLYLERRVFNTRKKRFELKRVPNMDIMFYAEPREIFRDIPDKAFQIILEIIAKKHTDILMLAALGAFAGMRPSECCNVRRADSALGAGIRFTMRDGEIEDIVIDISSEKNLRSDLVRVGGIKKERWQRVYPAFIKPFYKCYRMYMKHIKGRKYEEQFGALTVNRDGKAMTYQNYYQKFKEAIQDAIPALLASEDAETVNYGHLLLEKNISPHIFRHWFSVRLTLYGEDISGLMYWRGDKAVDSSLVYLQNKGDLEKQYRHVNSEIFGYQLWIAEKQND